MKVTLFGATGKTGPYLIKEALKRGMEITVFARTSSNFTYPNIKIIKGELTDKKLLAETIRGADAVISALGPTRLNHPKNLPITEAYKAIISVMEQEGVKRLITTSTGTAPDPEDKFDFMVWFPAVLIKLLLRSSYNDMIEYPKVIRSSNLDWTMARLAVLKDYSATKNLITGMYGHTKHALTISREDVAVFMFDQIKNRDYMLSAPGISSGKNKIFF
jgi:hypothetical protein